MKLDLDLTPVARAAAERAINDRYNLFAQQSLHRDAEHKTKRDVAARVQLGEDAPAAFAAEADLMGIGVADLAALILSKPDTVLERGLDRRQLILSVRQAPSPDAVAAIMAAAGFPANYADLTP